MMTVSISDLAKAYKKNFVEFSPIPTSQNRAFWDGLDGAERERIRDEADRYQGYVYPGLTASMFLAYSEGGDRSRYQDVYSQRREALNALVLGECVTGDGRYLKSIMDGIMTICEESAWNLPAHNTYIRDSQGPILPDYERPVLALFSCETGANLAIINFLLGQALDGISPMITKRIRYELNRRIISPYLSEHFWWMGREDEPMNNWTIWCTQSILITFFLSELNEDVLWKAFNKSCKSVDYFLKEYEEDGCCDEGALYYRKAALCLMNTLEILNGITGNHFDAVYKEEKVRNMAAFILYMQVAGPYYINFADCSAALDPSGVREYLFGKRTGNTRLMTYAARDYRLMAKRKERDINLFYPLQALIYHRELMVFDTEGPIDHPDVFYDSVGISVVRDRCYCLAVKAGNNGDNHNHNDVGSYTLYVDGRPFIVDIGVETYSAKTFSPRRYEIWTMQSDYHNLPTINGHMQLPGCDNGARDLELVNDSRSFSISMDIAGAYPLGCRTDRFKRHINFEKGTAITIEDRASQDIPVIANMIFANAPRIEGQTLFFDNGQEVKLEGKVERIALEVLPITDERLKWAWDHDLYRVRIYYNEACLKTVIRSRDD